MKRIQDWRKYLKQEIDKRKNMRFFYGRHDCCFSASSCVEAITGHNLMDDFFPYKGRREAEKLLIEHGGVASIAEKIASINGIREISVKKAQSGDIVLYNDNEVGYTLGVVDLSARTFLIPYEKGWAVREMSRALKAWRI